MLCASTAVADTKCQVTDPLTGQCTVWVAVPTAPPSTNAPSPAGSVISSACLWNPAPQHLPGPPAGPVACNSPYGYWANSMNCYVQMLRPQPPPGDPEWRGHASNDGAVYSCYQPQTDLQVFFWAQKAPSPSGGAATPQEVAQVAVRRMALSAVDIGIAPKPGPNSLGIVGMPVWMWVATPTAQSFGPITASASAGGVTVTATARVASVTWNMGDGNQVVCHGPGTAYVAADGPGSSPDCGHTYTKSSADQPARAYIVTATSHWMVSWSGAGQTGTIALNGLSRSVQIRIGEAQVLVQ